MPAYDLLSCPFCGGEAKVSKHFREDLESLVHRCKVMGTISIDWTRPGHPAELWNTRAAVTTGTTRQVVSNRT